MTIGSNQSPTNLSKFVQSLNSHTPNQWLGPLWVETPDIVADIAKYFHPNFDRSKYEAMPTSTRTKLKALAERLEFIDHLQTISQMMQKHKKTRTLTLSSGEMAKVTKIDKIIIDGHDFAGFDFDTDAIMIYLLITCIDTLKEQNYYSPFEWIKNLETKRELGSPPDWKQLRKKYEEDFGLTRNFTEAFTKDLDDTTKKEFTGNLAVVKIRGHQITSQSIKAWENRPEDTKLLKIAKQLYKIRSKFTHTSIRMFSPETPVGNLPDSNVDVLVRRASGPKLQYLLSKAVVALTCKLLIEQVTKQ